MTRTRRAGWRALCALALIGGVIAPPSARAQVIAESDVAAPDGAYLVESVTESEPAHGGRVALDSVEAFDPRGGVAVFEPKSADPEAFTYEGVDADTNRLTGVVRSAPEAHPEGSFVQALDEYSPSPEPSESPSSDPPPREDPSSKPPPPESDPDDTVKDRPVADTEPPRDTGMGNAEELAPPPRSYSTTKLVSSHAQLVGLGWSKARSRTVYRPFPVAGAATFTNTWGALRYGPAPGQTRSHEGQDIFCDFGAPILAVSDGRVQFDTSGLGGRIARLRMRDGSYWYYAHLSGFNRDDFASGDKVHVGDVIGYCGHSGNARTTPNHLHFGWYSRNEDARNPMRLLVGWLHTARQNAKATVHRVERKMARTMRLQVLGRMFGDSWAPDLTAVSTSASPPPSTPSPSSSKSGACDPGVVAPTESAAETLCESPSQD